MSYEKFITDFLNIKPSDLDKISTSTRSDGSVFIRVRLAQKSTLCPFCKNTVKVNSYYDRKARFSLSRYDGPLMEIIWEWCNNRSNTAFASVGEPKISPHLENGVLVVIIVQLRS